MSLVFLLEDLKIFLTDVTLSQFDVFLQLGPFAFELLGLQIEESLLFNYLLLEISFIFVLLLLGFFPSLGLLFFLVNQFLRQSTDFFLQSSTGFF
jgi:hypothetical protein